MYERIQFWPFCIINWTLDAKMHPGADRRVRFQTKPGMNKLLVGEEGGFPSAFHTRVWSLSVWQARPNQLQLQFACAIVSSDSNIALCVRVYNPLLHSLSVCHRFDCQQQRYRDYWRTPKITWGMSGGEREAGSLKPLCSLCSRECRVRYTFFSAFLHNSCNFQYLILSWSNLVLSPSFQKLIVFMPRGKCITIAIYRQDFVLVRLVAIFNKPQDCGQQCLMKKTQTNSH